MSHALGLVSYPWFGITYASFGVGVFAWGFATSDAISRRINVSLAGILLAVGAWNTIEAEYGGLRYLSSNQYEILFTVLFVLCYRSLCIALLAAAGLSKSLDAERFSVLPLFYLFSFLALIAPTRNMERPVLATYLFLVFGSVCHAVFFAFGRFRAGEILNYLKSVRSGDDSVAVQSNVQLNPMYVFLGTVLVTLMFQLVLKNDDWRLFGINAVLLAALSSLFLVSRSRRSRSRT